MMPELPPADRSPMDKNAKVAPAPKVDSNPGRLSPAQPLRREVAPPLGLTPPQSPKKRNSISTPKSSNNSSRRSSIAGSDTSSRPSSGSEVPNFEDGAGSPTSEARRQASAHNSFLLDMCRENGISPDQFVRSCHRTLFVEVFASKIDCLEVRRGEGRGEKAKEGEGE